METPRRAEGGTIVIAFSIFANSISFVFIGDDDGVESRTSATINEPISLTNADKSADTYPPRNQRVTSVSIFIRARSEVKSCT